MAYVRGSNNTTSTTSTILSDQNNGRTIPSYEEIMLLTSQPNSKREKDEEEMEETNMKPLVLFGIDLSFLSPTFRYLVLACGMFFFMCLYGYFQELVVYGWFQRKLSIFSTFLHFLGSSVFAQFQYHYSASGRAAKAAALAKHHEEDLDGIEAGIVVSSNYNNSSGNSSVQRSGHGIGGSQNNNNSIKHHRDNDKSTHDKPNQPLPFTITGLIAWVTRASLSLARMKFTMGTAPPRLAFGYYVLLVLLKTATQGFTTACMSHINYPAKGRSNITIGVALADFVLCLLHRLITLTLSHSYCSISTVSANDLCPLSSLIYSPSSVLCLVCLISIIRSHQSPVQVSESHHYYVYRAVLVSKNVSHKVHTTHPLNMTHSVFRAILVHSYSSYTFL